MREKPHILAVDDEKDMTRLLQRTLEPELNCTVAQAFSGKMALSILEQEPFDLVICDIKMPEMDGFTLLEHIKAQYPDLTVVMLTAFSNVESAVKAVKKGAYDFIPKPFEQDEIIYKIQKALERSCLIKENKRLLKERQDPDYKLIGSSDAMKKVYDQINLIADSDVTVLITGESGTGKDLTARSIHGLSNRKNKAYVPVNCPAIPEHILESELFGYKKGAFTNASRDKTGLFQEADKGTLFLDEIGDIGPSIQTKLLRVLQEKEIKPLGDTKVKKVDVRIIASTNRNLKQKIDDNEFRQDFFYRLNVISIELPPLRSRVVDIPVLAAHLVQKHCEKLNKPGKTIAKEVMDLFLKYHWPGNVRELENVLLQGVLYSSSNAIELPDISISASDLAESTAGKSFEKLISLPYKAAKAQLLQQFNQDYLGAKLSLTNGNVTQAARKSGLERQSFQQILKRYQIDTSVFKGEG
jgi:DNA-binding NtrC family response regulator